MQTPSMNGPTAVVAPVTASSSLVTTSADGPSPSLVLSASERALFRAHTVAALTQIAEDKRLRSEDKKEELRQLVGVRYRVLIETADTIATMHSLVHDSQKQYESIQEMIPQLTAGSDESGSEAVVGRPPSELHLLLLLRSYALAPMTIWSHLDAHEYESAAALYLSMQGVADRLLAVDEWPRDSEAAHPHLRALVEEVVPGAVEGPAGTEVVGSAIGDFFRHHAAYYREVPTLIARAASTRLQRRSLETRAYAECLAALAIVTPPSATDRRGLGHHLLEAFLESKRKQVHDLIWSAEQALTAFASAPPSAMAAAPSPTPVLAHACAHVIYTLQYTLLDAALLFTSLQPSANPNAALLSHSNALVDAWREAHVPILVAETLARTRGEAPTAATTTPPFSIDAAAIGARVSEWVEEVRVFVSRALSERLLPFLLPSAGRSAARSPCASLAALRDAVLRAANWEDDRSAHREDAEEEARVKQLATTAAAAAAAAHAPQQDTPRGNKAEEAKEEKDSDASSPHHRRGVSSQVISAVDVAAATRKRLQSRWSDACTLLFGRGGPVSLFDLLFFEPLRIFGNALVTRAFEKLTLATRVEKHLRARAASVAAGTEADGANGKTRGGAAGKKHLLLPNIGATDDAKEDAPSTDSLVTAPVSAPSSELHGAREDEVQAIVDSFQRQLRKLGRECGAILACPYVRPAPSTPPTRPTSSFVDTHTAAPAAPLLFPALQRYLQEELAPLLARNYHQLVEKLVGQLKKKLADLETAVLQSLSDVSSWRSATTLSLVDASVFIGRLCHELTKQRHLMSLDALLAHPQTTASGATRDARPTAAIAAATTSINPVQLSLAATSGTAFRIWTRYIAAVLSEDLVADLAKWTRTQMDLETHGTKFTQQYAKQAMSNRNPSGGAPLGLYLPVHASASVSRLLFQVHHHYYRAFGYQAHADALTALLRDVGHAVLGVVEKRVTRPAPGSLEPNEEILSQLPPHAALQMMFDVQFLFAVLRLPPNSSTPRAAAGPSGLSLAIGASAEPRARYAALLAAFESHLGTKLDQIDWMSSRAAFASNLAAATTRGATLFGVLARANPFPPTMPPTPASLPPTTHTGVESTSSMPTALPINIMPLAGVATKILPLPTSLYPSKHPQATPTPAVRTLPISSSALTTPFASSALPVTAVGSAPLASASATAASSDVSSFGGLQNSFSHLSSNLASQLSLAHTSAAVNAKVSDIGSSLLGKLSSNALWGSNKKQ